MSPKTIIKISAFLLMCFSGMSQEIAYFTGDYSIQVNPDQTVRISTSNILNTSWITEEDLADISGFTSRPGPMNCLQWRDAIGGMYHVICGPPLAYSTDSAGGGIFECGNTSTVLCAIGAKSN